jgi:hypothetical protein
VAKQNTVLICVTCPELVEGIRVSKTCSKHEHFLQKDAKRRPFLTKKHQKMLVFTLIFTLKTNMSYKITPYTTANRPIFQISPKIPHFLLFF